MNFKEKIPAAILLVFLLMPCKGWSQKTSTKAEAKVMLGTVVKANASGTQLTIEDSVGTLHQIALTSEMKIDFVGYPKLGRAVREWVWRQKSFMERGSRLKRFPSPLRLVKLPC